MDAEDAAASRRLHVQFFGAVAARTDAGAIELGGPRARALLSRLALARGRVLSADVLLTDVWGTTTPGVRSALRANVSRLRATPLGAHLVGGRQGYALVPSTDLEIDVWRIDDASLEALVPLIDAVPFDGAGSSPFLPAARASTAAELRRAVVRAIDRDPGHPLAADAVERLRVRDPDNSELRALSLGIASRATGAHGRTDAPASATRRIGMPAPIALFLPRPEDEARIATALRLSRLVSLVGPAGVGKSRLAVEWARGAEGDGQEHIWFARAGSTGGGWLHEVSRAVGADADVASLIDRMRSLRGTIVIDGADGTDAADSLAALLEGASGVAALVTARRPLGVPGESVQRVGALGVADARALFRLRAPNVSADDAQVDDVTSSVARLPLGIELAAGRAAQVPLPAIVEALAAPEPSGSDPLDAAVAATLALLSDAERGILTRLCVFRGSFHPDSAVAVSSARDAAVHIGALSSWSLLIDETRGDVPLLRVPEIIRRRLGGGASATEMARHREWFAARTLAAFDELTTFDAMAALQRLDAERSDIDAAFDHAVDSGDRASALGIAAGMSWAGLTSGTQAAALELARRAASVEGSAPDPIEARAHLGHGILAYQLGFMEEAAQALESARRAADRAGELDLQALSQAYLAYLATLGVGGTRAAVEHIRRAAGHLEGASTSARAMVTLISAQVERARGDHARALQLADEAHALAAEAGHGWVLLMSGVVAAKVHVDAREPRDALGRLRGVLEAPSVRTEAISVLIASSVAAGAAAGVGADAAGARIIGAVDAIGPRYAFDPRANEPADFDRYRRRVRQGLTVEAWQDAYSHGTRLTLADLIDETVQLASPRGSRRSAPG